MKRLPTENVPSRISQWLEQQKMLPYALALVGFIIYLWQAFQTAITKLSFLDEGLYLVKGFLSVSGKYPLFEDNGLWSNHMPLSFLIPGTAQVLFGPGLRTGRFFAIFIAVVFLIGLYLTVKKTSNPWFAALGVWVIAMNSATVKLYSMALTEGTIAAMFIWIIYLGVLPDRKTWQIVSASLLASSMIMTRENMILIFPLFVLFIFWQSGVRKALLVFLIGLIPLVGINVIYWPNILQIWAMWIPRVVSPFLDPWRLISDGVFLLNQIPDKASNLTERLVNLGVLLRNHFISFYAFLSFCILFPGLSKIKQGKYFKTIVFLFVAYVVLLGMHLYATFGLDYCVSCILLYVGYFEFLPIILLPILYRELITDTGRSRKLVFWLFTGLYLIGILISAIDDLMKSFVFNNSSILGRLVDIGNPIIEKVQEQFHLRYYQAVRVELISILLLVLILFVVILIFLFKTGLLKPKAFSLKQVSMVILSIGLILSPTMLLGKANDFFACSGNVLEAYEKAGAVLNENIPIGEKVYWEGRSNAILLYLKEINIYPPQLNNSHNYYKGGNADALLKMGRYNDQLASDWLEKSKYIILEKQFLKKWELEALAADGITHPVSVSSLGSCEAAGQVELYRR